MKENLRKHVNITPDDRQQIIRSEIMMFGIGLSSQWHQRTLKA